MLDTHKKNGVLRYSAVTALQEHLLMGYPITYLEAQLLFGVRNLTVEIYRLRKKGYLIMSGVVPMARVLRRVNQMATCSPPSNLPVMKIKFTEYGISE